MKSTTKWAISAIVSLCAAACIQREPVSGSRQAPVAAAQAGLSVAPAASNSSRAATGNYGKVAGVDLLDSQGVRAFQVNGKAERADVDLIKVNHENFKEAIRAKIKVASANKLGRSSPGPHQEAGVRRRRATRFILFQNPMDTTGKWRRRNGA